MIVVRQFGGSLHIGDVVQILACMREEQLGDELGLRGLRPLGKWRWSDNHYY